MTKVNRPKTAEELLGTTIKAKVKLFRYIYPQSWKDPQWGVVKVKIDELIDGELPDELGWDGYISVVGHLPVMEFREQYVFIGQLVYNPKYGYQYSVMSLHGDYNFESIEDQKKFLSFALTDHQIETVFATLENPMQVIRDRDVATLRKVRGVGPKTAEKIIKKYFDNEEYALAAVGLDKYGLTEGAIKKIVEAFKTPEAAIKAIEENPYVLIEKVRGYGWNKADKAARNAGLAVNDPRRARAYACYYLDERGESVGDSWAIIDDVLSATQAMCAPMSDETVVAAVKAMIWTKDNPDGELYYEPETRRISLVDNYNIEKELADHFHRLMKGDPYVKFTHEEIEQYIKHAEQDVGFEYTDEQKQAIYTMIDNPISILTGPGGVGKTYCTNAVYKIFESKGLKIATCALSGRASSKLTEITHKSGQTIHKLLGATSSSKFSYNAETQLPIDVLIIDECTLIGAQIFLYLLRAVKTGTRVIMLGDTRQLEPIGLGNVFADLLKTQKIPITVLTKIHRQAAASGIITESLKVSNGEQLFDSAWAGQEIRGELKDFKLDIVHDNALVYTDLMNEFKLLLNSGVPSNDIQILVPLKDRGNVCCKTLNAQVQSIVNPKTYPNQVEVRSVPDRSEEDGSPIPGTGTPIILKPNDRIIIMQNTYKGITNHEHEDVAVFNGNVGYIKEIAEKYMWVHLTEQGDVKIPQKHWGIIALGYAITVHKKQGDSSPYVIFALDSSAYTLLSKELIYTAITRARKYCTVVATNSVFRKAVTISRVRIKQTWLQFLL